MHAQFVAYDHVLCSPHSSYVSWHADQPIVRFDDAHKGKDCESIHSCETSVPTAAPLSYVLFSYTEVLCNECAYNCIIFIWKKKYYVSSWNTASQCVCQWHKATPIFTGTYKVVTAKFTVFYQSISLIYLDWTEFWHLYFGGIMWHQFFLSPFNMIQDPVWDEKTTHRIQTSTFPYLTWLLHKCRTQYPAEFLSTRHSCVHINIGCAHNTAVLLFPSPSAICE